MTKEELEVMNYIKDNLNKLEPTIPVVIPSYKNREFTIIRHLEDLSNNDIYVFVYENDYTESGYDKFDNKPNIHFVKIPANCGWRCLQRKRYFIQEYFKKHPEIHDYIMVDDDIVDGMLWTIDGKRLTHVPVKNVIGAMCYAYLHLNNKTYAGSSNSNVAWGHWNSNDKTRLFSRFGLINATFIVSNDYIRSGGVMFRDLEDYLEDITLNYDLHSAGIQATQIPWVFLSFYKIGNPKYSVASPKSDTPRMTIKTIKIMKERALLKRTNNNQYPLCIKVGFGKTFEHWDEVEPILNDESKSFEEREIEILKVIDRHKGISNVDEKDNVKNELNGFFED